MCHALLQQQQLLLLTLMNYTRRLTMYVHNGYLFDIYVTVTSTFIRQYILVANTHT